MDSITMALKSVIGHNQLYSVPSLRVMGHRRGWVMRFSKHEPKNTQKVEEGKKMSEGNTICDITGELLSNGVLPQYPDELRNYYGDGEL